MRRILVIVAFFTFGGLTKSFAEPSRVHRWELGPEVYYVSYREPGIMREKGMMYGATGSYSYHHDLMLKAEGRTSVGALDYKNSGTIENIPDFALEFRGLGGYDFHLQGKYTLTPYIGIGYRYLNDDSSGKLSSTGAAGYDRESNYFYSPVGVEGFLNMNKEWSLGATAEYDVFWQGKQFSHLSDANRGFNDLENTQKKGYGMRGSLKLQKKGDELDFVIEPFIRYWKIDKSNDSTVTYAGVIIGYGYEPKNNTTEYGVNLAMKF